MSKIPQRRRRYAQSCSQAMQMSADLPGLQLSDIYKALDEQKRLEKFLWAVELCSTKDFDIAETVDVLVQSLPSCNLEGKLTEDTFKQMIAWHHDVADAWTCGLYGSDIDRMRVRRNATTIATTTRKMDDIKTWEELYGSGAQNESQTQNSSNPSFDVTFNITTSDEKAE